MAAKLASISVDRSSDKVNACVQLLVPTFACALARGIAGDAQTFHVVASHQVKNLRRCFIKSDA